MNRVKKKHKNGSVFIIRPFLSLFCIAIFFCICSCNKERENLERFQWSDFQETKVIKSDTLPFEGPINPSSYQVLRDSLIISIDKKASEGHYVYIHKISGELVNIAGKKGLGPGELLSCRIQSNPEETELYVFDYLTQRYTIWDTDSILLKGIDYHPDVNKLNPDIEEVSFINKSTIIAYNSMYIETEEFSNNVPEVINISLPIDPALEIVKGDEYYFPPNVNGALLFSSAKKERIITADFYSDKFTIYDLNMNQLDQKNGPARIKPELFTPDGRKISFANGLYWRSFYPSAYNEDNIYLLYVGLNGINTSVTPIDQKPAEIWKLDWNGNIISRIKTDVFLTNISIDNQAKFLYGTTWSSTGSPPRLVRIKL